MMETFRYSQFPPHLSVVHVALYKNTTNSGEIRTRIIHAATAEGDQGDQERAAVNFAFIDARLITSQMHLLTAVYQAILSASQGSIRTKTVHSEILWALNPTNNISEAIRRYGVSNTTSALLVVRITSPEVKVKNIENEINAVVTGTLAPLVELENVTDWSSIKKYYKLANEPAVKSAVGDIAREHRVVDNIVVSSVAMKSVMG